MDKSTTRRDLTVIAVDRTTLYRLNEFKGKLQVFRGKHVTQADALNFLLDQARLPLAASPMSAKEPIHA